MVFKSDIFILETRIIIDEWLEKKIPLNWIRDSHSGDYVKCCLLGSDVVSPVEINLSVEGKCCLHLQGRKYAKLLRISSTLKLEVIRSS
jgi:hypothetical protein